MDGNSPPNDPHAEQSQARARSLVERVIRLSENGATKATSQLAEMSTVGSEHQKSLSELTTQVQRSPGGKQKTTADLVFKQSEQINEFCEFINRVSTQLVAQISTTEQVSTMLNDIATLGDAIDQLSHRSQYLSLNAMIEAARLGDDVGRGFMVIAQDMRELNQEIEETATRIGSLVETLLRVLPELHRAAENIHTDTDQMDKSVNATKSETQLLTENGLSEVHRALSKELKSAETLNDHTDQVLQDMDYQDRVGQVLRGVVNYLEGKKNSMDSAERAAADSQAKERPSSSGEDDELVFF